MSSHFDGFYLQATAETFYVYKKIEKLDSQYSSIHFTFIFIMISPYKCSTDYRP